MDLKGLKKLAKAKGGKCLSSKYSSQEKLKFRCKEGHTWESKPHNIKDSWCPYCAGNVKITLKEIKEIARSRSGRCLEKTLAGKKVRETRLRFQCGKGHTWKTTAYHIKAGHWCPYCAGNVRLTLGAMQEIAESRGGECLSTEYINNKTKLRWRCANGHLWESTPTSVKGNKNRKGTWCPVCAKS